MILSIRYALLHETTCSQLVASKAMYILLDVDLLLAGGSIEGKRKEKALRLWRTEIYHE